MQFAIVVYETDSDLAAREDPTRVKDYWAAYTAYSTALREAGVARGGAGLQPPTTATSVRLKAGKRQIQDGPFIDAKERLAGFFVIEVPSLDKALEWAARCPAAAMEGGVEVRPCIPPPPGV